jgi:Ni,Fe-hydrogenase maturation factor
LLLAEKLHDRWADLGYPVRLLLAHQLGPDMALDIAAPDVAAVLFVDTAVNTAAGDPPLVELTALDAAAEAQSLTHHLAPTTLLLYAARLFDHHPQGWMMRVTGADFDHGDQISPSVTQAVSRAADNAEQWWQLLWPAAKADSPDPKL